MTLEMVFSGIFHGGSAAQWIDLDFIPVSVIFFSSLSLLIHKM